MRGLTVALFLTLGLSALANLADEPRLVACGQNQRNIGIALEMYGSDHQGQYPKSLSQLVPIYLKKLPTCYAAKKDTYSATYRRLGVKGGAFYCQGSYHTGAGLIVNQPTYDSVKGLGPPGLSERIANYKPLFSLPHPQLACKENLVTVAKALENYADDHQGKYPAKLHDLIPRYLKSIPHCQGRDTYSASYKVSNQTEAYSFYCKGKNHVKEGFPPDRPLFNIEHGLDE